MTEPENQLLQHLYLVRIGSPQITLAGIFRIFQVCSPSTLIHRARALQAASHNFSITDPKQKAVLEKPEFSKQKSKA